MNILPVLVALFSWAYAFPSAEKRSSTCTEPVILDASKNIWLNYTLHPQSIYRPHYIAASELINNTEWESKALKVADSGVFLWIESQGDIAKIDQAVKDVPCGNILGLVISGLSHAGCDETIGRTPWQKRDSTDYLEKFIASIVARIKQYEDIAFALIIEPELLPFVVRNPYYKECETAQRAYRENVPQALKALDLPNTINYLDAKHGGWFGWNERRTNYDPKDIARELTNTWQNAGGTALKQFRGVSVNVKSYNAWDSVPGEAFSDENVVCADLFNRARNEQRYISIIGASLKSINSTFPLHAIFDSSRSAVQGIRYFWHDWCNNLWAGLGPRPTLQIQQQVYARDKNFDAFVWATPVGFSDGTSDVSSPNWHANCSSDIAFKPMPEKGIFSQGYFESLLKSTRWSAFRAFDDILVEDEQRVKLRRRCDGR